MQPRLTPGVIKRHLIENKDSVIPPPLTSIIGGPMEPGGNNGGTSPLRSTSSSNNIVPESPNRSALETKLVDVLSEPNIFIGSTRDEGVRKLAWLGLPEDYRPMCWRLLTGYLSTSVDRRPKELHRKRREYFDYVTKYYTHGVMAGKATEEEQKLHNQILLDLPRHSLPLFRMDDFRTRLERVLYIWSLRHPASGYVQGMDDIVYPFFYVFLESRWSVEAYQSLDTESLNTIEADTYWCAGTLLGWVQDHYTFAQPGIQLMVHRLQHVMQTADPDLYVHITDIGVNFMQFGYQWMHCLLVREVPLKVLFRLWDTYLAEGNGFADLHVFVCASLLLQWKDVIMGMHEFEGVLKYLQNPPTSGMSGKDVDAIVSRAYLLQIQYNGIK